MKIVWGIDGGGTTTRGVALNSQGEVLARVEAGPSNILLVGSAEAERSMCQVVQGLPGVPSWVVAGMAGASRHFVHGHWEQWWSRRPLNNVTIVPDYRIAWRAINDGESAILGILGTGSVFYAESQGVSWRGGGYGWALGDPGSGQRMGQRMVQAACSMWDGVGKVTMLAEMLTQAWAVGSTDEALTYLYATPNGSVPQYASLARDVFHAAQKGDVVALRIVDEEADAIVRYLQKAVRLASDATIRIGLMGGLSNAWIPILQKRWHGPPLESVKQTPVDAAGQWALLLVVDR